MNLGDGVNGPKKWPPGTGSRDQKIWPLGDEVKWPHGNLDIKRGALCFLTRRIKMPE